MTTNLLILKPGLLLTVLLLAHAICIGLGSVVIYAGSRADPDTLSGPEDMWDVLEVEHEWVVQQPHKCDEYKEVIIEVMMLAVSIDPEAKEKQKQIKATVQDLIIFNECYELALLSVEEAKFQLDPSDELVGPGNTNRDGKLFGDILKLVTRGVQNIDSERNSGGFLHVKVQAGNRGNLNNWGNWNNLNNWNEWCIWGGRSWNDCFCDEDLCCRCEPDLGGGPGSCCWNWCENICNEGRDVAAICKKPNKPHESNEPNRWCSDRTCRKFHHCCSNTCSPHTSSLRRRFRF